MPTRRSNTFDAGDVLVVGAGATGLLAARELEERGKRCTIVESHGLAHGQSGHSHGYLHSGYAYLDANEAFIGHLRAGTRRWKELFHELDVGPTTQWSQIAFQSAVSASAASSHWKSVGLPVNTAALHEGVRPESAEMAFRTEERSYDFPRAATPLLKSLSPQAYIAGQVTELTADDDLVSGARVELSRRVVDLRARYVVLAAGVGNEALTAGLTRHRGRAVSRTSYMMVLRAPSLPRLSIIYPDSRYGLFAVSRVQGHRVIWLVSNYISYARLNQEPIAERLWVQATLRTLYAVRDLSLDVDLECAVYEAPKMELRAHPGRISSHAAEDYGFGNLIVAAPTKLTLAPVLAEEIADKITHAAAYAAPGRLPSSAQLSSEPRLSVSEQWTSLEYMPWADFLRRYDLEEPHYHAA